ncbi:hypothetical protein IWQ56_002296 [Coemansia nantahalensis]|uniref:Uncharacterized protein n=1 Tax=Coemansia helicoidea TaxID=1286919 RepID=A0ACC1LH16_9FUNG|nr:hypothetical protein IWQ56_002296 [Coemansia nantahalensis]KAJ2807575.1 hypothetical protein H4R21_000421 [Coemansia helicoidea]
MSSTTDTAARVVLNNLEGTAYRWASQQLDDDDELLVTSAEFLKALQQEFTPFHDKKAAEAELDVLRQTTTVAAYTAAFQAVICRIPGMTSAEKCRHYARGLKNSIRHVIDKMTTEDFDAVRHAALTEDTHLGRTAAAAVGRTSAPARPAGSDWLPRHQMGLLNHQARE